MAVRNQTSGINTAIPNVTIVYSYTIILASFDFTKFGILSVFSVLLVRKSVLLQAVFIQACHTVCVYSVILKILDFMSYVLRIILFAKI